MRQVLQRRSLPAVLCLSGPADVEYGSRNVLSDPELREGIKQYTHWPTIPQAGRRLLPAGSLGGGLA